APEEYKNSHCVTFQRRSMVLLLLTYSPPRTGGEAAPSEAKAQTGWSDRRNLLVALTTRRFAPLLCEEGNLCQEGSMKPFLSIFFIDALSSKTNKSGDVFLATLAEPIIVHGDTVLARGVKLQGRVLEAEGSGRVKGRAKMSLALTNVLDGQKEYAISTSAYSVEAESTKKRDAGIIGGA